MTASYQNQKFLIDGKYYSYEQLIPPIEEPNIASKIKSFLFSALKPIKEAPLQGLSGLWGGVQGSLMSGSSGGDPGEARWVTANSYQWEMPEGVTSVSVVCVGAGGAGCADEYEGGGGGGLAYMNNISVTAGNQYAVSVGAGGIQQTVNQNPQNNGGDSWFNQSGTCRGVGGQSGETNRGGGSGGGGVCPSGVTRQGGDGGGREESAGSSSGGGGAAGYAGNGGRGGDGDYPESPTQANTAGAGGGGGGGLYGSDQFPGMAREDQGGGGGGTGIYGQGPNGGAGTNAQFGGGGIG